MLWASFSFVTKSLLNYKLVGNLYGFYPQKIWMLAEALNGSNAMALRCYGRMRLCAMGLGVWAHGAELFQVLWAYALWAWAGRMGLAWAYGRMQIWAGRMGACRPGLGVWALCVHAIGLGVWALSWAIILSS